MKRELMELMEENNFYNRMTLRRVGHIGILLMAMHVAGKAENKYLQFPLLAAMLLFVADDIEIIIHSLKKMKENDQEENHYKTIDDKQ